ncbi:HET-domain-containing protein [Stipitochalara longipes BDJ]|nr:HET-domain-containing protein [Stipitochalara longipes BDJ]
MAITEETCTNCELLLTSTKDVFLDRGRGVYDDSLIGTTDLDNTFLLFLEPRWVGTSGNAWPSERWAHQKGYLSAVQPIRSSGHFGFRLISPESFDHQFVKDCISYCSLNHSSCKTQQTQDLPIFFRVIDCKTRQVVVAEPGCQYLALSYVWGATTGTSDDNPRGLDKCPKVINDSIDVTLMLTFRYLWVDRYCVDQLDAEDKHHQIQQMDLIYANAIATIIAAGGDDPEYGLPGVNGTSRKQQPHVRIRGHLLASSLPHPSLSVNRSRWATRGWTYQESILSRRRILFTDEQVLFECNSMHCTESQSSILDELHRKDDKNIFMLDPAGSALKWKTPTWDPSDIIHFLAEFSKRELSYPTDAINAMQGIFQMFSRSHFPVYHLEGVPVVSTASGVFSQEYSFLKGLSWYHNSPGKRRPEFPSWSWAGWTGRLGDSFMYMDLQPRPPDSTAVRLETGNKELEKFPKTVEKEDWQEFTSKLASIHVKNIYIQGNTLQCTAVHTLNERSDTKEDFVTGLTLEMGSYKPENGYLLQFKVDEKIAVYLAPNWDLDVSQLESKALTCICLSDYQPRRGIQNVLSMLVVEENAEGLAERVGCCNFEARYVQVNGEWVYARRTRYWSMLAKKVKRGTIRLG